MKSTAPAINQDVGVSILGEDGIAVAGASRASNVEGATISSLQGPVTSQRYAGYPPLHSGVVARSLTAGGSIASGSPRPPKIEAWCNRRHGRSWSRHGLATLLDKVSAEGLMRSA